MTDDATVTAEIPVMDMTRTMVLPQITDGQLDAAMATIRQLRAENARLAGEVRTAVRAVYILVAASMAALATFAAAAVLWIR